MTRSKLKFLYFFTFAFFSVLLISFKVSAQTPACVDSGDLGNSYQSCSSGVCTRLVCDGSAYIKMQVLDYNNGTVNNNFGNDSSTCDGDALGRLRYDGSSTWEYCNATSWTTLVGASVSAIDDLSDAAKSESNSNIFIGHDGGSAAANNTQNTALGINALDALNNDATANYGDHNTAIGYNALTSATTGYYNTAVGSGAMAYLTSGTFNTGMGQAALGAVTTGYNNVAIGYNSLKTTTDGYNNVAVGINSLRDLTSGFYNTAFGSSALQQLTTGRYNIGIGQNAVQTTTTTDANIGIGNGALQYNISGGNNIAIGLQAGQGVVSSSNVWNNVLAGYQAGNALLSGGNANVMLGFQSGLGVTTGTKNILIGNLAGDNITTGAQNIVIGPDIDSTSASGNYYLNIGNAIYGDLDDDATSAIGDNGADITLDGTLRVNSGFVVNGGEMQSVNANAMRFIVGDYGTMVRADSSNFYILLTDSGTPYGSWNSLRPFRIEKSSGAVFIGSDTIVAENNGNLGVNQFSPQAQLDVNGNVRIRTVTQDDTQDNVLVVDADGDVHYRDAGTIGGGNPSVPTDIKATTSTTNGSRSGYDGLQTWIESNGCSGYYVCTGTDIIRYIAAGNSAPSTGWYMTGLNNGDSANDCSGWNTSSSGTKGRIWYNQASSLYPTNSACDSTHAVLCCTW